MSWSESIWISKKLDDRLSAIETLINGSGSSSIFSKITALQNLVNSVGTSVTTLNTKIDGIASTVAGIASTVAELQNSITDDSVETT